MPTYQLCHFLPGNGHSSEGNSVCLLPTLLCAPGVQAPWAAAPGLLSGRQLGSANGETRWSLENKRRQTLVFVSSAPAYSPGRSFFPIVTSPTGVGVPASQVPELTGFRKHSSLLFRFDMGYDISSSLISSSSPSPLLCE